MPLTTTPEGLSQSDHAGLPGELVRYVRNAGGEADLRTIDGRGLGFGTAGKAASVAFTIGAEGANAITVSLQFKDADGNDLAQAASFLWWLSSDADGQTIPSAPSGGTAAGTDGTLIESVAQLSGQLICETDGDADVVITDSGTTTWYLNVMVDGRRAVSGAITFA